MCTVVYAQDVNNTTFTATEFRNRIFEILNLAIKGGEFVIEKDGRPAARLVPYVSETSRIKAKKILNNFKSAFSKVDHKKHWSVLESKSWKEKEQKYLKNL